jgi:hypothetical protein
MLTGQIHIDNCNEILSDVERREITAQARTHAEWGFMFYTTDMGSTYWARVVACHRILLYEDTFKRRTARIERTRLKDGGAL